MRRNYILILCAALIAILPLLVYGCSCGHDFDFHLQSWMDAAQQLRHGTLQPHWIFSAAYNAGEPRFIFYPPISWMLGALLTLFLPATMLPAIYTFIVLTAAGLAMYRLAVHFAAPNAALIAATLYIVNPYMLFTAYERTAYAELLAAAWLPLLFLAILRARPTISGIALPVALLWLTNAPAAVMGCYALALVMAVRITLSLRRTKPVLELASEPMQLAIISIAGTALGLALPAFYLIPAAYERRFVQIAMAIIPNMRFQDNFLFGHTGDVPHDQVLHTASVLALILLGTTAGVLLALFWRGSRKTATTEPGSEPPIEPSTNVSLALVTVCIGFLLIPFSTPLWNHLPELAFLQFPWRLMSVLAVVLGLGISLLLRNARATVAVPAALALAAALTFVAFPAFRQPCEDVDLPSTRAALFANHQGIEPTDEYTPNEADNDVLRDNDPPFWLSPDPAAFAPDTTPNPGTPLAPADRPVGETSAIAAPRTTAPLMFSPGTFTVSAAAPEFLILNLRRYPAWHISVNGHDAPPYDGPPRDDGLIVVPVDPGVSTVQIDWHRTPDQQLGIAISGISLLIYAGLVLRARSRRIAA